MSIHTTTKATMKRLRRKSFLTILAVVAACKIAFFYVATSVKEPSWPIAPCFDNSLVQFDESGSVDTSSRWRRLGASTYVFTAYLDDREPCSPVITVLGFGVKWEPSLYGTLLLHNGTEIPLGMTEERRVLNPYGPYTIERLGPYAYVWALPCRITDGRFLKSIAVEQIHRVAGRTKVEIPITIPVYSTKTFGVCIDSPLFGTVRPLTIIENVEINKVLGAEWFTFYIYAAEETTLEVLRDYAREGLIEVVLKWGNGLPEQSTHYFGQTLSINECAYRNMYRVKYLVYTDLDELIVPKKSLTWSAMMARMEAEPKYGTYLFRHAYFFPEGNDTHSNVVEFTCSTSGIHRAKLPNFLTRIMRSQEISPPRRKSKYITKPLFTSAVGVHEVFAHAEDFLETYVVAPDFALLHHYRSVIPGEVSPTIVDVERNPRAFVHKVKIISALRKQWCRWT